MQSFQYVDKHPLLESVPEFTELMIVETKVREVLKEHRSKIKDVETVVKNWGWNDPVSTMYQDTLKDCVLEDKLDYTTLKADLEWRNKFNMPPGGKDKSKQANGAGDLIIWLEILELGKSKKRI
jgi:hypothetical protein